MIAGLEDHYSSSKSTLEDAEPKRRKQTLPTKKKQHKLSHVEMKMIKSILPNNIKNNIVVI